jgi:hypothetical protein
MHELLPVQDGNAQVLLRQFKRNGSADDAPADDHDIVGLHADILSACARGFTHSTVPRANLP